MDQKDKNKKNHLQEADHIFKGHCQVLIHNPSLQVGNIKARRPPEFAVPVGFSRGGHGIYCAKHLKQYSAIGGWVWHPWLHLSGNYLVQTILLLSLCHTSHMAPKCKLGGRVGRERVRHRGKEVRIEGDHLLHWNRMEKSTNPFGGLGGGELGDIFQGATVWKKASFSLFTNLQPSWRHIFVSLFPWISHLPF